MELQFSILSYIAMAVFYFLAFLVLSAFWLVTRKKRFARQMMAPLVTLVLALPWADEIWIAYHFKQACEDAGVHVNQQVMVDGFYDATTYRELKPGRVVNQQWIDIHEKKGFKTYEYKSGTKVANISKSVSGQWDIVILDEPQSRYHYKLTNLHTVVGYNIKKYEEVVLDSVKNESIGRDVSYSRYPGWMNSIWMHAYGSGQSICKGDAPTQPKLRRGLPYYVFLPTNNKTSIGE